MAKSIQLNQNIGSFGALRAILREALVALNDVSGLKVESVVQSANRQSLLLHEKLGFKKIKEGPKATRYSLDAADLRSNLKRLFRPE